MAAPSASEARAIAAINASKPPQSRKRVWRACIPCKKKKAKCDGSESCQTCLTSSTECVYPEEGNGGKGVDMEYVQTLEGRLLSMETMFKDFIQLQQSHMARPPSAGIPVEPAPMQSYQTDGQEPGLTGQESAEGRLVANSVAALQCADLAIDGAISQPTHASTEMLTAAARSETVTKGGPRQYTDEFGVLEVDTTGQLRYMGISATISIRDTCDGLRMHINNRLQDKGHAEKEYYFDSPSDTVGAIGTPCTMSRQPDMPPEKLVDVLLEAFFDRLHSLFPIVQYSEIQKLYHRALLDRGDTEIDFIPVLFAILAVATPLLDLNHSVFQEPECEPYRHECLATYFYAIARNSLEQGESTSVKLGTLEVPLTNERNSIWKVQGWGLVSMYLAGAGSEAEAWVAVGRAVRLGQDLGLHRSPEMLRLPHVERRRRRCVWLSLYVLDRSLSISLGRTLAINDLDCDVTAPENGTAEYEDLAGFFALVALHRLSGEIITMTNSVGMAKTLRDAAGVQQLRDKVAALNTRLRSWATEVVPPHVRNATTGRLLSQRCVLLSVYFAAIMALHRPFMANPHRASPLGASEIATQCARAAINCIHSTSNHLASIPKGLFLAFHGQQILVASVLLMHCLRLSKDELSASDALRYVEISKQMLHELEPSWAGARKGLAIVEAFLEFTIQVLESGNIGVCHFSHSQDARGPAANESNAAYDRIAHCGNCGTVPAVPGLARPNKRKFVPSEDERPLFGTERGRPPPGALGQGDTAARLLSPPSAASRLQTLPRYMDSNNFATPLQPSYMEEANSELPSLFDVSGTDDWMNFPFPDLGPMDPSMFESPLIQLGSIRPNGTDSWDVF